MSETMQALEAYLREISGPHLQFFNELKDEIRDLEDQLVAIHGRMDAINKRAANQKRSLTKDEDSEIWALTDQYRAVADKIDELEHRPAGRKTQPDHGFRKSLASGRNVTMHSVVNHDRLLAVSRGEILTSGTIPLPSLRTMLNVLTSDGGDSGSSGDIFDVQPRRRDLWGNDPRFENSLLAALPKFPLSDSNELEFPILSDSDSGSDRLADYQDPEGSLKKQTDLNATIASAPVVTLAHFLRASRQVLADAPLLQSQIESLLKYGVLRKAEREILNGSGAGRTIEGLNSIATPAVTSASASADRIGEASVQLALKGWRPNLVILNPADYFAIASERATAGNGQYVASGWNAPTDASIWGLRKVLSAEQAAGTAIILDSSQTAVLDREQAVLRVDASGDFLMTHNLVLMLAEIRLGLAVFSPDAVRSVDLNAS